MKKEEKDRILGIANSIFWAAVAVLHLDEKSGAYYSVLDIETGQMGFSEPIGGMISPEKEKEYCMLSQEKAYRLSKNIENGHLTSLESSDVNRGMYGGAIKGRKYIHSISGLPSVSRLPKISGFYDSIAAVSICAGVDDISDDEVDKISEIIGFERGKVDEIVMISDVTDMLTSQQ